ncbi:MAG: T9SS type A sorting domain-containing protein [Bacteroidota bacterium]
MSKSRMSWLAIFVFAILASTSVLGQVKSPILGTIINGGNFGPGQVVSPLELNQNCKYTANFSVLVSNLEETAPDQYAFPQQGYPPMYLQITIDGETSCHEVTEFFPHTDAPYSNIFYGGVDIEISLNEYCFSNYPGSGGNVGFSIDWEVRILQEGSCSDESPLYPICSFTEADELFSSQVFLLGAGPHSACNSKKVALYDGKLNLSCGDCNGLAYYDPDIKYEFDLDSIAIDGRNVTPLTDETVSVVPNPFESSFTLSWASSSKQLQQIDLYNAQGYLLKQWSGVDLDRSNYIDVNTAQLLSGVYFLSFRYPSETLVRKIIKR